MPTAFGTVDHNLKSFHLRTEIYREWPDPSFPMHNTESNPHWGWLGLACETTYLPVNALIKAHLQNYDNPKMC